ncbi:hypothetical protein ACE6H2_025683 [Prunus campanulata]
MTLSKLKKFPYSDYLLLPFICSRLINKKHIMEEGMSSTVSNIGMKMNTVGGVSDSSLAANDSTDGACKRVSKKFKGVVEQPNGHWGAQIYANHERVWLGTFNSEIDAAMGYDSAALKLRGRDCHRNFPWTETTFEEQHFQNQYATEVVLSMIKDGSYQTKFSEFRRSRSGIESVGADVQFGSLARVQSSNGKGELLEDFLFQKELTPSDVGKLNRLVIPSKYACTYFPTVSEAIRGKVESCSSQLTFYDRMMRSWTFRFCFWKSSKSFVFTKGWSRFVRTHDLQAKDTIRFLQCQYKQSGDGNYKEQPHSFCMIQVKKDGGRNNDVSCLVEKNANSYQYDGVRNDGGMMDLDYKFKVEAVSPNIHEDEDGILLADQKKCFRLFGVEISDVDVLSSHSIIV